MSHEFTVDIGQADIDDLHHRLDATRWPDMLPGVGWTSGAPLSRVQELAAYWRDGFDWRAAEKRLNTWPQLVTTIDGTTVHHVAVRSPRPDAQPLLLVHGWPGSYLEYLDTVGPLTDPEAYGGSADDPAFHVVLPSLPGYTFSGPVPDTGWGSKRVARALTTLMSELGHDTFVVHGGDWGERIARDIAMQAPERVRGVHLTTFFCSPPFSGSEGIDELTPEERVVLDDYLSRGFSIGYFHLLSERPQTLGYGWSDSPVSLLAWMVEKFAAWTDWQDSPDEAVDVDTFLTNVSMYWFTNTGNSAGRLYHEEAQAGEDRVGEFNATPTGCGIHPKEMSVPIRSLVERSNNVVFWAEHDRGGHFAALEEPDLVVQDLRSFVRVLDH
ncbi:epoxide hydrolase [Nocardioides endophyticus]|uniref:Epoxide hydrolase n=1 Tax=Nocardioides endophyticus TaxID=1353775 RepID=A0ABP8ZCL5_9ACTN